MAALTSVLASFTMGLTLSTVVSLIYRPDLQADHSEQP